METKAHKQMDKKSIKYIWENCTSWEIVSRTKTHITVSFWPDKEDARTMTIGYAYKIGLLVAE